MQNSVHEDVNDQCLDWHTTLYSFLAYIKSKVPHLDMLSYVPPYTVEGVDTAFISFGPVAPVFVRRVIQPYCLSTYAPFFNQNTFWVVGYKFLNPLPYFGVYLHSDEKQYAPEHYKRLRYAKLPELLHVVVERGTSNWLCPGCHTFCLGPREPTWSYPVIGLCLNCRAEVSLVQG